MVINIYSFWPNQTIKSRKIYDVSSVYAHAIYIITVLLN